MRPRTALVIAAVLLVFVAVSFELARFLTAASHERDLVFSVLVDEARGDGRGVAGRLRGCDATCVRETQAIVARQKRRGRPKILSYDSPTAYAFGRKTAPVRVAWAIVSANGLPVVQCVTVRRHWSFLSGGSVSLRRLSPPIGNESSCPG